MMDKAFLKLVIKTSKLHMSVLYLDYILFTWLDKLVLSFNHVDVATILSVVTCFNYIHTHPSNLFYLFPVHFLEPCLLQNAQSTVIVLWCGLD